MISAIREALVSGDHIVWYYINSQWQCSFLDAIMPFIRNQWTWAPLYLFLALYMPLRFGKSGWLWCAGFLLAFILSDQLSATVLKPFFHRVRPCNNPNLSTVIHLLVPCGGGYSFPSSHAANHFSLAVFSAITLSRHIKGIWPIALFWAALVTYAQVYVGVHFPIDVACGAMLGIATGNLMGRLFNRQVALVTDANHAGG